MFLRKEHFDFVPKPLLCPLGQLFELPNHICYRSAVSPHLLKHAKFTQTHVYNDLIVSLYETNITSRHNNLLLPHHMETRVLAIILIELQSQDLQSSCRVLNFRLGKALISCHFNGRRQRSAEIWCQGAANTSFRIYAVSCPNEKCSLVHFAVVLFGAKLLYREVSCTCTGMVPHYEWRQCYSRDEQ